MAWFYISFIEADSAANAIAVATMRGLNPGGEAQIIMVSSSQAELPELEPNGG